MSAANTDVDKVYHLAITLFPDLNIRLSDLQHPTESFLTKTFVNFLKAFGFRIEPPFNLDNDSKDPSREKRVFLAKLCRQVEKILQYSFPNKSYTYVDIIEPSAKKTKNTLDFLFNYWAYYKLYKKDVLAPVEEKFKQRESLIAEIEQKRLILEQRKEQAISMITDIEKAQQDIGKLRIELPKAEEELQRQKTLSKEQKEGLHHQEKRHEDLLAQVKHWEQKVVKDAQVEELLKEIETTERSIETYQKEFTTQKQVYQTQREEIDSNKEMVKNLEELMEILPPGLVEKRMALLEHIERLEKELSALESQQQKSVGILSTNQQQLQQSLEEYKRCKNLQEKHEKERLQHIDLIKNEIEDHKESANQLEDELADLQLKIEREESTGEIIQENVKRVLGQYWQSK